ncbi:MAG: xanthine dehydrogenase accessory protein XdhC [Roseicyclus sp.]|nr:xanthine dehydrogenase accessory protein XdhC [Roseicyclus sp.]
MSTIRVTITDAKGSAPREAGTAMLVHPNHIDGTIGGGALEWEAMRIARNMLQTGAPKAQHPFPLGPSLGQCCGGAVTLDFEATETLPTSPQTPLWVWGAGHVGRALIHSLSPLPGLALTWIDTAADRFPQDIPSLDPTSVHRAIATDPPKLMPHAPIDAHHLILTYSHDIDLALCHAALSRGFASCGVIGSATKWNRFRKRLRLLGHGDTEISRITCPIGDPSLGKHPQAIAIGVAATLLGGQMLQESAQRSGGTGGT